MISRLGVNIDHIATLRQARGENYPSVVDAANVCMKEGADQITIHLREDRRHIQDTDVEAVRLVTKKFGRPLNLEMGCNQEIIDIAIATVPDWICLVPENREEKTTEGGLNLLDQKNMKKVCQSCQQLRDKIDGVRISLFLESNLDVLEKAIEIKPDAVEIHTGDFARVFMNGDNYEEHIEGFRLAQKFLVENSIAAHAGHGLSRESVVPLLDANLFDEYNIGHWIICQAVFNGLGNVVKDLKELFRGDR